MATQTLLQYLEAGAGVAAMHRRQVETFLAAEAITEMDLVAVDLSKSDDSDKALYIVQADSGTATAKLAVGFALNSAAAGEKVDVCVAGICQANVDGATAQGDFLCIGSTAGQAGVFAESIAAPIIAIASEADTSNEATVFVIKQF